MSLSLSPCVFEHTRLHTTNNITPKSTQLTQYLQTQTRPKWNATRQTATIRVKYFIYWIRAILKIGIDHQNFTRKHIQSRFTFTLLWLHSWNEAVRW